MVVIDLPASPVAAEIAWSLRQPSISSRSEWSGARRTTILPQAPRWTAKVKLPTITGEAKVLPWRAALARLQGRANAFRLIACERPQLREAPSIVVNGAGQSGTSLSTRGWPEGVYVLPGMFVTHRDRLHQIVEVSATSGATRTLTLLPYLSAATVDGERVEVLRPYGLMSLLSDEAGWMVGVGQRYDIGFDCEEAF